MSDIAGGQGGAQDASGGAPSLWAFASSALSKIQAKSKTLVETAASEFREFRTALASETEDMKKEMRRQEQPENEQEEEKQEEEQHGDEAPREQEKSGGALSRLSAVFSSLPGMLRLPDFMESEGGRSSSPSLEESSEEAYRRREDAAMKDPAIRRRMQKLAELQSSRDTYLTDPVDDEVLVGPQETQREEEDAGSAGSTSLLPFSTFSRTFAQDFVVHWRKHVVKVLATQSRVNDMHLELVPERVSEVDFWCRYVYRIQQLDRQEERRQALLSRSLEQPSSDDAVEPLTWDEEEEEEKEKEKEERDEKGTEVVAESKENQSQTNQNEKCAQQESQSPEEPVGGNSTAATTSADAGAKNSGERSPDASDGNSPAAVHIGDIRSVSSEGSWSPVDEAADLQAPGNAPVIVVERTARAVKPVVSDGPAPAGAASGAAAADPDSWDEWE